MLKKIIVLFLLLSNIPSYTGDGATTELTYGIPPNDQEAFDLDKTQQFSYKFSDNYCAYPHKIYEKDSFYSQYQERRMTMFNAFALNKVRQFSGINAIKRFISKALDLKTDNRTSLNDSPLYTTTQRGLIPDTIDSSFDNSLPDDESQKSSPSDSSNNEQ